jgi:branched-chain amino acid transport system substrate-binding protein
MRRKSHNVCYSQGLALFGKACAAIIFLLVIATHNAALPAEPINIGFGIALSGPLAGGGKSGLVAYQMWAEEVNARGGLLGRQVKLVYYDDQSKPETVPGIYAKLLDIDKVDLVVSPYATNQVAAALGHSITLVPYRPATTAPASAWAA